MIPFTISKASLFSLLLAMLLAAGIAVWDANYTDACTRFESGDRTAPTTEVVVSGTRMIRISCDNWVARLPLEAQLACLLTGTAVVAFICNLMNDLAGWLRLRRQWRRR